MHPQAVRDVWGNVASFGSGHVTAPTNSERAIPPAGREGGDRA